MKIPVKIKKLKDSAIIPSYAHEGDAALDLHSCEDYIVGSGKRQLVSTGIAMELPQGYFASIRGKSGLAAKKGIDILGGVIEYTYRGEYGVIVYNTGEEESQILAKTAKNYDPEKVAESVKRKLRQFRNEKEGEESFSVQTSGQLLETFTSIFSVVQAVIVGIASISLLVGGVGIMNTMYTAVLERTKEIGTMKAIGAKNSDILTLFLILH